MTLGGAAGSAWAGGSSHFRKGPYLQNVSQTSITIVWQSDPSQGGVVEIEGTPVRRIESAPDEIHEVVIDKLSPSHRYRYSVTVAGERIGGQFATAPPAGSPFSFVVFGDTRENVSSHERVVDRVREEAPDFIIETGDMVNEGSSEHDWQLFFDVERDLLHDNVLYPSVGNHDRQGRGRTADNYRKYFSLPENSPDPERYYAFTYGSARFLVLDSNVYSFALTDQTEWIEQQLEAARLDPSIHHIFVSMHHPPYSVSLHGGQEELREAWTPLFEKYQVAAVFSGHDHVYERAEKNGVHYFVTGGGGAPLYPRKSHSAKLDTDAVQYFERVNHYLRVHVIGDFIEVAAIRADGTLIETTSWGTPPSKDRQLVARTESAAQAIPAAGAGTGAAPGQGAGDAEVHEPAAGQPAGTGGGGFGLLGALGVLATLAAAGGMIWSLRR